METVAEQKVALRDRMRGRLAALSASEVRAHSAAVWERLAQLEEFKAAQCISAYVSTGNEIETHGLIRQLLAMDRCICLPAFVNDAYKLCELRDFDRDLRVGRFGIPEPKELNPSASSPAVLLVPGLAFDVAGNRLGRGRGIFDAILRDVAGTKIALAHDFQLLDEIPVEKRDVPVDFIITEARLVAAKEPK